MPAPGRPRCTRAARAAGLALACAMSARPASGAVLRDNLYDVKAVDGREAWAVGNFGAIYHTADAGKTWQPRDSGTKAPLFGVDFAGRNDGWVVGKSALILHTKDAGATWTRQTSPIGSQKPLFKVRALDARTAWAVGDWGAITVTHDGGETWEDRSLTDDVVLYDVSFPDAQHGFVAGGSKRTGRLPRHGRGLSLRCVGVRACGFGIFRILHEEIGAM